MIASPSSHRYEQGPKRLLDAIFASIGLIVLAPIMLATAVLVRVQLGRPVFFCQIRPGRNGKSFTVLKFRTMRMTRTDQSDEARLTTLGRWLRASSIDEVPELWNVLIGEMSLVGPRPLLPQYLRRYTPGQARRHEVRPGITGWAQVNGRNALSWENRFRLDVWYVDHCSFALDVKILWLTVWQVIARRGINQPGHATAEEFLGSAGASNGG